MNEPILTIMVFIWIAVTLVMAFFQIKFNYRLEEAKKMGFGKKKKPIETAEADVIESGGEEAAPKPTAEQQAKIDEMKGYLDYFNDTYARVDFGDNMGGLKQLLFAIFCELKKVQEQE